MTYQTLNAFLRPKPYLSIVSSPISFFHPRVTNPEFKDGDAPTPEVEAHSQKLKNLLPLVDRRLRKLEYIARGIEQPHAFVGAVEVLCVLICPGH